MGRGFGVTSAKLFYNSLVYGRESMRLDLAAIGLVGLLHFLFSVVYLLCAFVVFFNGSDCIFVLNSFVSFLFCCFM